MKRSKFVPPSAGLADIAPVQSSSGAVPSGLAQPPLSPYVSGKKLSTACFLSISLLVCLYYLQVIHHD